MKERSFDGNGDEDTSASGSWFKYALIAYVVIEFIALAFAVWYKASR